MSLTLNTKQLKCWLFRRYILHMVLVVSLQFSRSDVRWLIWYSGSLYNELGTGRTIHVWLSCYLGLLSVDSKTRQQDSHHLTHTNTTSRDFVGVMSGWVFSIAILLCIDKGVPVAHRPTKLGPSRHFRCELARNECWKKPNISINRRRHFFFVLETT